MRYKEHYFSINNKIIKLSKYNNYLENQQRGKPLVYLDRQSIIISIVFFLGFHFWVIDNYEFIQENLCQQSYDMRAVRA